MLITLVLLGLLTNGVGGVVGTVVSYNGITGESKGKLDIKNVYTTGDLYSENGGVGAVYGSALENVTTVGQNNEIIINNVVYITPTNDDYSNADAYSQRATKIDGVYGKNTAGAWDKFINAAGSDLWRVYDGTTPILNEYLPNSKKYFDVFT